MDHDFGPITVETLVTGKWKENCYLVMDKQSGELAIIDPGDDAEAISKKITDMKGHPSHILITHGHFDHIGAVSQMCELTGLPCSVDQRDLALLRRAPLYAMVFEKKGIIIPGDFFLFEGAKRFHLGSSQIDAWPSPGHTPGSVCYHFGAGVFTGDTLLNGQLGRTDLPGGDTEQLVRSVEELTSRYAGETVLLPGHGPCWTLKEAREWCEASEPRGRGGPEKQ